MSKSWKSILGFDEFASVLKRKYRFFRKLLETTPQAMAVPTDNGGLYVIVTKEFLENDTFWENCNTLDIQIVCVRRDCTIKSTYVCVWIMRCLYNSYLVHLIYCSTLLFQRSFWEHPLAVGTFLERSVKRPLEICIIQVYVNINISMVWI